MKKFMEKTITTAKRAYHATRRKTKKITQFEKARFILVGAANTITDFVVLLSLVVLFGIPSGMSNIASTTCALIVSFLLNKKAVFQGEEGLKFRQIIIFIVVTLACIWLVQTVIMVQLNNALTSAFDIKGGVTAVAVLLFAKVIGIAAGSVWNYMWYSRVVFKKQAA